MPKGTKEYPRYSALYFHCRNSDIRRQFPSEKEMETYLIRHSKFCSCSKTEEATGTVSTFKGRTPLKVVVNDITLK